MNTIAIFQPTDEFCSTARLFLYQNLSLLTKFDFCFRNLNFSKIRIFEENSNLSKI